MKRSAGILPYKIVNGKVYVYLEHPGGPYWENKDLWSICKGEYREEKAIDAAIREFAEETGFNLNRTELFFIGSVKLPSTKKLVTIFGVNKDLDVTKMKSNNFTLEWPPGSGNIRQFPEMDKAGWFEIGEAKKKIFKGQEKILDKLICIIDNAI